MVLIAGDASGLGKSTTQATKQLNTLQKTSISVGKAMTAAFAAVSFASLGREVVEITAEFQKFEAVLINTLGSKSEAQEALKKIQTFAAKTPFSVQEVTAAFVKLANQGFTPTTDELRKLGDLASSTGKTFDQLAEAILDAQSGQFERLREFGIRAEKQGDQVKFTFKGVETQTKFTSASIQEYLLSLGDLKGVSGSAAAISATLGGSISNLGDSFGKLLLSLGSLTDGPLKFFIDQAQLAIQTLAQDISGDTGLPTVLSKITEEFVDGAKTAEQITANIDELTRSLKVETAEAARLSKQTTDGTQPAMEKLEKEYQSSKETVNAYGIAIELLTKKLEGLKTVAESKPTLGIIQQINADLQHFEDLKNKAFSVDQIGAFNVKIQELRDQLELLNATGSESGFLKKLNAGEPTPIGGGQQPTAEGLSGAFPTDLLIDTQPYLDSLAQMDQASADFHVNEETRLAQSRASWDAQIAKQMEAASAAESYGQAIGDSLGQAVSGQITFAQAMKKITADLVKMFLQRALAGIISSAATSGGPPPVAIALAAAGVAAISAMFSKIGSSGGGGGTAAVSSQARNSGRSTFSATEAQDVKVSGAVQIRGQDLWVIFKNQQESNQFLRAGG